MITPEEVKSKTPQLFWEKIKFKELGECWEWQFAKDKDGYGRFKIKICKGVGKTRPAHRYIYKIFYPNFNLKLMVLHTCDNPSCVNPNHLFAGTARDNTHDMINKGRLKFGITEGIKAKNSKLKDDDIPIIRILANMGISNKSIGQAFNIHDSVICRIKKGEAWSHIK